MKTLLTPTFLLGENSCISHLKNGCHIEYLYRREFYSIKEWVFDIKCNVVGLELSLALEIKVMNFNQPVVRNRWHYTYIIHIGIDKLKTTLDVLQRYVTCVISAFLEETIHLINLQFKNGGCSTTVLLMVVNVRDVIDFSWHVYSRCRGFQGCRHLRAYLY